MASMPTSMDPDSFAVLQQLVSRLGAPQAPTLGSGISLVPSAGSQPPTLDGTTLRPVPSAQTGIPPASVPTGDPTQKPVARLFNTGIGLQDQQGSGSQLADPGSRLSLVPSPVTPAANPGGQRLASLFANQPNPFSSLLADGGQPAPSPSLARLNPGNPMLSLASIPNQQAPAAQPQTIDGSPSGPGASDPLTARLNLDQNNLARLQRSGSGIDQITHPVDAQGNPTGQHQGLGWKILGGVARLGDFGLTALAPGLATLLPETTLNHGLQLSRDRGAVANDQNQLAAATSLQDQQAQLAQRQLATQEGQLQLRGGQLAAQRAANEGTIVRDGYGRPIAWQDVSGVTHAPGDPAIPTGIASVMSSDPGKPATSEFELWHRQNPNGTAQDYQQMTLKPLTQEDAVSRNAIWDPLLAKHGLPTGIFKPGMSSTDAQQTQSALAGALNQGRGDSRVQISLAGLDLNRDKFNTQNGVDLNDPATLSAVQSVANGSMKLTDVFGRGATLAQKSAFAAAVKQVNPNFNSGDHDIEVGVKKYMTSGQGGSTLTAGNTLTHHLDLYDQAVDALHNGDVRPLNALGNQLGVQLGKDAKTNLDLVQQGVAMEAARFWTGGAPGLEEVNSFKGSLNGDGSPAQMHGGANTIRAMAQGKLEGLQGQYNSGMQGQPNFGGQQQPVGQAGGASGKAVSLAKALQLPQFRGQSPAAVSAAIQAQGHQVIP